MLLHYSVVSLNSLSWSVYMIFTLIDWLWHFFPHKHLLFVRHSLSLTHQVPFSFHLTIVTYKHEHWKIMPVNSTANNIKSWIVSSERWLQSSAFTIWSEWFPLLLSSITAESMCVCVCTVLCWQETNLPLMKTFDSFSEALQHSQTLWWKAVSAGLVGKLQPHWLHSITAWRTMWKPAFLSLSHLITQICFQLSRFSFAVWNTVWCWGIRGIFCCSQQAWPRVILCFEGDLKIWNCLPLVAALSLCVIKPYPPIMHQTDGFLCPRKFICNASGATKQVITVKHISSYQQF